MNDFTDHLESWWNNASVASPREGDTIIYRESRPDGTHYYGFEVAEEDFAGDSNTRILERAPKPKPAWHDAVAVLAHTKGWGRRRVFTRYEGGSTNGNHIWSCGNLNYGSDDLIVPAPLIEAKVTDSMVLAAINASLGTDYDRLEQIELIAVEDMRHALTAALGLDPRMINGAALIALTLAVVGIIAYIITHPLD